VLGAGTDPTDKPLGGCGHQALLRWVAGCSGFVGQVIPARSCQPVGRGVPVGGCWMLAAEMPAPFAEGMAVTACEMERDSPGRGDAGPVLDGVMGKQE